MGTDAAGVYCRGTVSETEDILDFANMVFSMSYGGIDFARQLPKAYAPQRRHMLTHHLIKENGRIRALIDTYPLTLRQAESAVCAAYIGTVSVHPDSRGKGYMTALMAAAEADARARQCDLMILDGRRHRYRHFGFEQAGIRYSFKLQLQYIREYCENANQSGGACAYRFVLMEPGMGGLDEVVDKLYRLYMRRTVTARTREDFHLCLQSMAADAYAVFAGGEPVGYMNISEDGQELLELEIQDGVELPKLLWDFMQEMELSELEVTAGADEASRIDLLDRLCGRCQIGVSHQIKILNYPRVLTFLLKWKQQYAPLADGEFVVGVAEDRNQAECRRYCLRVEQGGASVCETQALPAVILEEMELVRMVTTGYYYHAAACAENALKKAPAGWFPLPFHLPNADTF